MDFYKKSIPIRIDFLLVFHKMKKELTRRQKINSAKRIIILLMILFLVIYYKWSIGNEFEWALFNYYVGQQSSGVTLP